MSQIQKKVLEIDDLNVIKIFNKPFTKQIINCFDNTPKTASEIAHAVAFPKDKIYYHLKKLLAVKIIFIAETEIVKGIEQKSFLPVAKHFEIKNRKINTIKVGKILATKKVLINRIKLFNSIALKHQTIAPEIIIGNENERQNITELFFVFSIFFER